MEPRAKEETIVQNFAREKKSPYIQWVQEEGLDIIDGHYLYDLKEVPLKPWARRNGAGVYLNHESSRTTNDCYICEIAPGDKLTPQRQLYEEMIYIIEGNGSTVVWDTSGKHISFEWQAGSMFAIPINALHQHFNGSGQHPVRFLAVTNCPVVMNLYGDPTFIFHTEYAFTNRFNGEADYFHAKEEREGMFLDTNFVPNTNTLPLSPAKERGAGGGHIRFNLAKGSLNSHISEFPTATYKKAHLHGPGAHLIILSGEGYTLMWPEGEEPKPYKWKPGTLIVPPDRWYHQHFNTGTERARYLALKYEGVALRNSQGIPKAWLSKRIGGDQIDYADESPLVRQWYEEALAKKGMVSNMKAIYEEEGKGLPPKRT